MNVKQGANRTELVVKSFEKDNSSSKKVLPRFKSSTLNRFTSSLVATITAVTVASPFDVLKTRMQVQGDRSANTMLYSRLHKSFATIVKQEGIRGLFRGYKATLMTTPIFHSIYFPVYEGLRRKLSKEFNLDKSDFVIVTTSSAFTGILCNVITNPLWLVRIRMQAEVFRSTWESNYTRKYKSVFRSVYNIYQREGFFALYTGLAASMIGISHVAIYFPLYEQFKSYFKSRYNMSDHNLSSKFVLMSSVSAKLITSWITYPHELVRARQQDTRLNDNKTSNVFDVIKRTYMKGGFKSFYHGFSLSLIKTLPQNAILFVLYEYLN